MLELPGMGEGLTTTNPRSNPQQRDTAEAATFYHGAARLPSKLWAGKRSPAQRQGVLVSSNNIISSSVRHSPAITQARGDRPWGNTSLRLEEGHCPHRVRKV